MKPPKPTLPGMGWEMSVGDRGEKNHGAVSFRPLRIGFGVVLLLNGRYLWLINRGYYPITTYFILG